MTFLVRQSTRLGASLSIFSRTHSLLTPSLSSTPSFSSSFSTSSPNLSHIGSAPVPLPSDVTIRITEKPIDPITRLRMELDSKRGGKYPINLTKQAIVTGPRGELTLDMAEFVNVDIDGGAEEAGSSNKARKAVVTVNEPLVKAQRSMWGTTRASLSNGVIGVTEGHISIVKFVGTGFRALLEKNEQGQDRLLLRVGYCVPIKVEIPEGIKVQLPLPHRMVIEGNDKQQVKLFAANIRKHRKPEPYKGKGIFVDGETIKLKVRKIK